MDNERRKQLELTLKEINKTAKEKLFLYADSSPDKDFIPFGIKEIDDFMGGGVPLRKYTVDFGSEDTGKSTRALHLVVNAQKLGKICCYIDLERKFDKQRAKSLGVVLEDLVLAQTIQTAEEAMDAIRKMAQAKVVDLVIVDSIQAMSPKGERETKKGKEKSIENDEMALLARKLGKFFRVTSADVFRANMAVYLIGQVRMNLGGFFAFADLSGGNCFDDKTRILTKKGLKFHHEVKVGDLIPTINLKKNKVEYKSIKDIYIYNFNGYLNQFKQKTGKEFLFTDNHKCLVKMFKWDGILKQSNLKNNSYKIIKAKDSRQVYAFPICFPSGNKEYKKFTDDELKLLGWVLTDGTINIADKRKSGWRKYCTRLVIYQSKIKYIKEIIKLLKRLNIDYSEYKRTRTDKRFPNKTFKSRTFQILVKDTKKYIKKFNLTEKRILPDWVFKLSDRQAKILFGEMMKGDGSKRGYLNSYIADGRQETLEKLAHLCVTHNIPVSKIIKSKTKNCWYLLLQLANYVGFTKKQKKKIKYNGLIWDISVPNELHFIEKNGQIIATHNSLKHWMSICIFSRKGQKADFPVEKIKSIFVDPDGKEHKKTVSQIIGFDCVLKMVKSHIADSVRENKDIHIPFYYETGFKKPSKRDNEILNMVEEELEGLSKVMDVTEAKKELKKLTEGKTKTNIKEYKDSPPPIKPPDGEKKRRGRPKGAKNKNGK